jgi:hypothetical protein
MLPGVHQCCLSIWAVRLLCPIDWGVGGWVSSDSASGRCFKVWPATLKVTRITNLRNRKCGARDVPAVPRRSPRTPLPRSPPDERTFILERGKISARQEILRIAPPPGAIFLSPVAILTRSAFRERRARKTGDLIVGYDRLSGLALLFCAHESGERQCADQRRKSIQSRFVET